MLRHTGQAVTAEIVACCHKFLVLKIRIRVAEGCRQVRRRKNTERGLGTIFAAGPGIAEKFASGKRRQLVGHQCVVHLDRKEGQVKDRSPGQIGQAAFCTELKAKRLLCTQRRIKPAPAWIVELGRGGGLKGGGDISVERELRMRLPAQARRRAELTESKCAGIIPIGEKMIRHVEAHYIVAQRRVEGQVARQHQLTGQIAAEIQHPLVLVQIQRARPAVQIVVVFSRIILMPEFDARHQTQWFLIIGVARPAAEIKPFKTNLTATLKGQLVGKVPLHRKAMQAQLMRLRQWLTPGETELFLPHALAAVVLQIGGSGLTGIGRRFRRRQPTRIVLQRVVDHIDDSGQLRAALKSIAEFGVQRGVAGMAVVAVAFVVEGAAAHEHIPGAVRPAGFELTLKQAIIARREARFGKGPLRRVLGLDADHPAGGRAIDRGCRAADHLNARRRTQIDTIHARLPVRQRRRNPIDYDPHAANPEVRARPKAADRDAAVLREVVRVERKNSRHGLQRFVERELGRSLLNGRLIHHRDRRRHFRERRFQPGGFYFVRLQLDDCARRSATSAKKHTGEKCTAKTC